MGRPPVDRPTGRKVTLYMLPDVETAAREIGSGSLSGGVREAVQAYNRISKQGVQARKAKKHGTQRTK